MTPVYQLSTAHDHPELARSADDLVAANLPDYMMWESPGNWRWSAIYDDFPDFQIFALDGDALVAAAHAVPLRLPADSPLPTGFDDVLVRAVGAREDDAVRDGSWVTSMLSISVHPDHRGRGLPTTLLAEVRRRAADRRHRGVLLPLRPTAKHRYPRTPIESYLRWVDAEGEPFDPWLRTHLRAGGTVLGICPRSLVICQPLARWAPFLGKGDEVDGALAPLEMAGETATYAEPNIWVWHEPLSPATATSNRELSR